MVIFGLDGLPAAIMPVRRSVSAARSIVGALPGFNRYMRTCFNHEFTIGLGIHSGTVILGSLGFHKKKEYTALGDRVNTASRIEACNQPRERPFVVQNGRGTWRGRIPLGKAVRGRGEGKERIRDRS
jgi:adenylate cyclase